MDSNSEFSHLRGKAQQMVTQSDKDRIEYTLRRHWIGYPRAQAAIARLEDLLTYPKNDRMPNLLLYGKTNNGKTMVAKHFLAQHPSQDNSAGSVIHAPIVYVQAPASPKERAFHLSILDALKQPTRATLNLSFLQHQVLTTLKTIETSMVIIDEFSNLLNGTQRQTRHFLNLIKNMANELKIPLIGLGTEEALQALRSDPQLDNRFHKFHLPPWEFGTDFLSLLATLETQYPLRKPSNLVENQQLAQTIFALSEGLIGEVVSLLSAAAASAIRSHHECIDERVIKELEWTRPSKR